MSMSGSEEDPYSKIFSSLRHPTRRLLLRSLKEQPSKRFSKLQSELGIDSPTLSYHLDALTGLVERKGDGYSLTELGTAAFNLMGRVEETKKRRAPALTHRVRFGIALVMVLVLLAWGTFALTWTIPNDRASILDSVLHGQPSTYGHALDVQPGTNATFFLGMFYQPPRPGLSAWFVTNGVSQYSVPRPSTSPWETKVDYAVFFFTIVNGSGKVWLTNPDGILSTLSCGLGCNIQFPSPLDAVFYNGPTPGFRTTIFWFTEMSMEGNYTLHVSNTSPELARGNVTVGASTVVYSKPYFLAGTLTIIPAAAYLSLAAYSLARLMQREMTRKDADGPEITAAGAKTMAATTPASFLKKCRWCGYNLPIAAESCYECGKSQT